jgi:hypothetical protein
MVIYVAFGMYTLFALTSLGFIVGITKVSAWAYGILPGVSMASLKYLMWLRK